MFLGGLLGGLDDFVDQVRSQRVIQRMQNHGAGLGDSKMSCAYPSIRWPS